MVTLFLHTLGLRGFSGHSIGTQASFGPEKLNKERFDDVDNDQSLNDQAGGDGETNTPKAVVKPNVITHVIEGHIIHESNQPFALDTKGKFYIARTPHEISDRETHVQCGISQNWYESEDAAF